jgi:hypothetical protein
MPWLPKNILSIRELELLAKLLYSESRTFEKTTEYPDNRANLEGEFFHLQSLEICSTKNHLSVTANHMVDAGMLEMKKSGWYRPTEKCIEALKQFNENIFDPLQKFLEERK